ncbi:cytochrome P450 [Panus rudis PR-1116 ss-1]|nr:cytochrome P450 [Panus rudis PR-1116 ss-1]
MAVLPWYLVAAALAFLLCKALVLLIRPFFSPLRSLRGPPSSNLIFGQLLTSDAGPATRASDEGWTEKYGPTFMFTGLLNSNRLFTVDTRAINHVLTHSTEFQKPPTTRYTLTRLLGDGVLVTEGEKHRQQRRVLNPAFGPSQIRELTSVFNDKSIQLRDIWIGELERAGGQKRMDVLSWLSRATLDIIGLAGFNYEFNALNESGEPNELNKAFKTIFFMSRTERLFSLFQGRFPILSYIPTLRGKRMDHAQGVMRRIGMELIAEKKAALLAEKSGVTKRDIKDRDLLTLLIKANMAVDIPEDQRMSDEEVLAQVPTFLIAGHETTSTAVTWCLLSLCKAPHVQRKLREELLSVQSDAPTMDELMSLPYLDMVVRENLRVNPPVPLTIRQAVEDSVIPVGTPYTDKYGVVRNEIRIAEGDGVFVPVAALNQLKELWGEDATEFKPERWETPPKGIEAIPGVWGHLLSFLGGPRACIGYRFSLVEMKALLFALLRSFEFALACQPEDIGRKFGIVTRPYVKSEPEAGNQLPLIVKLYRPAC